MLIHSPLDNIIFSQFSNHVNKEWMNRVQIVGANPGGEPVQLGDNDEFTRISLKRISTQFQDISHFFIKKQKNMQFFSPHNSHIILASMTSGRSGSLDERRDFGNEKRENGGKLGNWKKNMGKVVGESRKGG